MTSATASILTFALCLVALGLLFWLGLRQAKRAAAASHDEAGSSFLAGMSLLFAVLASPVGILFAHLALRQITRTGASGARLATVGLCIAYGLTVVQLALLLGIALG